MTLQCPVHHEPITTDGKRFHCPAGHAVYAVDMDEVIRECAEAMARPTNFGPLRRAEHSLAGE